MFLQTKNLLIVVLMAFFLVSCSKPISEPKMLTGNIITNAEIRTAIGATTCGKYNYATVRREWVEWYYKEFRKELSSGQFGVTDSDSLFQCTAFTTLFSAKSQLNFRRNAFHSDIQYLTSSVAIGEFWYAPSINSATGHAIIVCFTENGLDFFEPQTGNWVQITPEQLKTSFFKKFD